MGPRFNWMLFLILILVPFCFASESPPSLLSLLRRKGLVTSERKIKGVKIEPEECVPAFGTTEKLCKKKVKRCGNQHQIYLKWVDRVCQDPKTKIWDGGCMCRDSCQFSCKQGCEQDEYCSWNPLTNVCSNKKTGNPGGVPVCEGVQCRKTGFFCDAPGGGPNDQSNCCNNLHCKEIDLLFNCCSDHVGTDCIYDFDCCPPNVCVNGECAK